MNAFTLLFYSVRLVEQISDVPMHLNKTQELLSLLLLTLFILGGFLAKKKKLRIKKIMGFQRLKQYLRGRGYDEDETIWTIVGVVVFLTLLGLLIWVILLFWEIALIIALSGLAIFGIVKYFQIKSEKKRERERLEMERLKRAAELKRLQAEENKKAEIKNMENTDVENERTIKTQFKQKPQP